MKLKIGSIAYRFDSQLMKDLDKIIHGGEHLALADDLLIEFLHTDFDEVCYIESVYRSLKKSDIRGMGALSYAELALKLVKFIKYYEPQEVYNNEEPRRNQ